MPGIIVGVDGSGHSQRALEWAMKEAAMRHAPLTVLTVHPAIVGYFGGVVTSAGDLDLTEQTQAAVKVEADRVLAALDGPHPESVTVKAVHGFPVEELVSASKGADIVVLGSRGRVQPDAYGLDGRPGRTARALPGPHHPARGPQLTDLGAGAVRYVVLGFP
jgi:nucleotide-binding universal stress UspA family protein